MPTAPPVALTIAGSDSSAGAGIQADLKTFAAHGVYGVNALTAIVAEVPEDVATVSALDPTLLYAQIKRVMSVFPIAATKTGMLANASLVEVVVAIAAENPRIPWVVDPVIRSGAGPELLSGDGFRRLREELLPLARLCTPNLPEAESLLGCPIQDRKDFASAPRRLFERYGCNFLVKGGHFGRSDSTREVVDHAWIDGEEIAFPHPCLAVPDVHGTGCTLSAAITARLALGHALRDAIALASDYLSACLETHHAWPTEGGAIAALNHFPHGVE